MAFVRFMGWRWPQDASALLSVSIVQVLDFRGLLLDQDAAPKTINRRISSLSSFCKFLAGIRQKGGRIRPECLAGFTRKGGRIPPECVAACNRNQWPNSAGIRGCTAGCLNPRH